MAEVHAALLYYYDHKDEIDAAFAEDERAEAEHETKRAQHPNRTAR